MPKLIKKSILMLFMFIFILAISPVALQNDTFFDISVGGDYIQNGFHAVDNFSVHKGLLYQTHHLFENIIIYKIYNAFNYIGLYIFEIILTCIIALLFYLLNKQFTKSGKLSYSLVFLEMFMFSIFISLRAQMFSSIIFLLELLLINKYLYGKLSKSMSRIVVIILTLLPVLLINFHSGVIFFYYIILGVHVLNFNKINLIRIENDKTLEKGKLTKLLVVILISLPLLVFNAYGINGITYMFKTLTNSFINANIQEFQPFNIKVPFGVVISMYFAIHIISLILSDKNIKIHEMLFLCGTLFMTMLSIRHFIFYVITTVVLIPHIECVLVKTKNWLYDGLTKNGPKAMSITVNLVLCFVIMSVVVGKLASKVYAFVPTKEYPVQAVEYIKDNIGYDKVIFNEYSWGSYMMINNIKVFIDSRCDLYTTEYNEGVTVAEDYMKTLRCQTHYEDTVSKYNIQYFLITKKEPLAIMLLKDSNYENVYEDDLSYIFKKK